MNINNKAEAEILRATTNKKKNYSHIFSNSLRYVGASAVFVVGFMLSPLTWWNDLVVNLPIAWLIASIFPDIWFKPAVIAAYWLTNIVGLLMMHFSGNAIVHKKAEPFTWRTFWEFIGWSTLYSILFWLLMYFRIVQPINLTEIMETLQR